MQGPSASAYVTYFRPEDALAAIRTVNNLQIDGRTLKASLGTTKYCSHFLKNTQCLKPVWTSGVLHKVVFMLIVLTILDKD